MVEILEYVEKANKKLQDFQQKTSSDKELQKSIEDLRRQVNESVKVFTKHGFDKITTTK